ncbi:MAG TPA: serine/threonine-protein kinase [Holophaga sp.]|jgi:serine/threonine-protein kinase|nr:serine/threonine-protein kinase [Holophaga sp.]
MANHPTHIGRYLVQRLIGQGAMGVVYLAEDPILKRRLAVKVVRATGEERDLALERFQREAEISAQLNHPNIVTIFDVGEEPGLGPFLAMEFVEGNSLGKLIRDGSLDAESSFSVLIQTMRALRAAHRHAIIHRDVKPDNVLVGEDGRVKLMDFGIAKTMAPRLTSAGEFLGSPAYSAPELLKGGEPTPSSDRFAFAVTAFEVLTGQLPHPGNNVAAVITHVLQEPPVIPQGMSGPVGNVFRKALALDPDDRFETLMEFITALVDAFPLDDASHARIEDLFRHDDHPGDIVPVRRSRPRMAGETMPGIMPNTLSGVGSRPGIGRATSAGTSAGKATAGRATGPRPMLAQNPGPKIELSEDVRSTSHSPQGWEPYQEPRKSGLGLEPKTLVKWIILILIGGNLFWWIYDAVRRH